VQALLRAEDGCAVVAAGALLPHAQVGYFEGIANERGIAWRCSDSMSLRDFLRLENREQVPDHSWLSKTRGRLPREVHERVFGWVLKLVAEHGLQTLYGSRRRVIAASRSGLCHRKPADGERSLVAHQCPGYQLARSATTTALPCARLSRPRSQLPSGVAVLDSEGRAARTPWTMSLRRYLLPRLVIRGALACRPW
jgi:hypothetical protein